MKKYQFTHKLWIWSAVLLLVLSSLLTGCELTTPAETTGSADTQAPVILHQISILENDPIHLEIGDTVRLHTDVPEAVQSKLVWTASNGFVGVTQDGEITAQALGETTITVAYSVLSDSITVIVVEEIPTQENQGGGTDATEPSTDASTEEPAGPDLDQIPPTTIVEAERSPEGYEPAGSHAEALERSQRGELSGYPYVPDQAPIISEYRPMEDGKYIKNTEEYFLDDNTYVVVDAYGREVLRVYRGGGYITLEEVAAYVWAFGDVPANHSTSKKTSPTASIWGQYLRVNHSKFSGDTGKYPYEPALPRISGCGGDLTYYEMDIGTTGTDCDPGYDVAIYNNGSRITRGAARIVYARFDRNGNAVIDPDEKYVFYTYNHYNDFREYLNYYGGWGEMFGNVTGGGVLSSKTNCNPTPYVSVVNGSLRAGGRMLSVVCAVPASEPLRMEATLLHCDFRRYSHLAA